MPLRLTRVEDVEPQSWRNGGGHTSELLAWPSVEQWDLRISVADIEVDGPFSSYEGVERWIAVISGTGIALSFSDTEHEVILGDGPLRFDGATAPGCRLINGPTRDLNLMVQGGVGAMRPVRRGVVWKEGFAMRGLFTATPGQWTDGHQRLVMPAMTLLWAAASVARDWKFEHDVPSPLTGAWWLGFTPRH